MMEAKAFCTEARETFVRIVGVTCSSGAVRSSVFYVQLHAAVVRYGVTIERIAAAFNVDAGTVLAWCSGTGLKCPRQLRIEILRWLMTEVRQDL